MANGAIAITGAAQIVKRGRRSAQGVAHRARARVTLEALLADFGPGQHARVGGAVRLMARCTAFQPHRCVLESERAALVAMARQAPGFVELHFGNARQRLAMRIVTIDTGHRPLRDGMTMGLLKLGPGPGVAGRALPIDIGGGALDLVIVMHRVTGQTRCLPARVAALNVALLRAVIPMAGEADIFGGLRFQPQGIGDVLGLGRLLMLLKSGVAAGAILLAVPLGRKCFCDFFVTGLTDLDVGLRNIRRQGRRQTDP